MRPHDEVRHPATLENSSALPTRDLVDVEESPLEQHASTLHIVPDVEAPPADRRHAVLSNGSDDDQRARGTFASIFTASSKLTLIMLIAWGLLFNFSEVRGSSMEPGIHDRDRILVDHVSYMFTSVERGDIVVLRYPLDPSLDYIKRVVGLPGDEIVISGEELWVNGELYPEPYVSDDCIDPTTHMRTVVEPGEYFVLGDNRIRSSDSREFGEVPFEYLRGKVRLRLWPPTRIGWVD